MATAPRPSPQVASRPDRLVMLPPGFVPLTDQDRARAVTALRALFVSYLRRHGAMTHPAADEEPNSIPQ